MDTNIALEAFSALSQQTRLDAFRLLMRHEPEGMPAGEIAERLGVPQNTLSTHLGILTRAGLASAERHGRQIIYRAMVPVVRELIGFMVDDCCSGHPELCLVFDKTSCSCVSGGADASETKVGNP